MHCSACGSQNSSNAKNCVNCGQQLGSAAADDEQMPAEFRAALTRKSFGGTWTVLLLIFGLGLISCCGGGGILFFIGKRRAAIQMELEMAQRAQEEAVRAEMRVRLEAEQARADGERAEADLAAQKALDQQAAAQNAEKEE